MYDKIIDHVWIVWRTDVESTVCVGTFTVVAADVLVDDVVIVGCEYWLTDASGDGFVIIASTGLLCPISLTLDAFVNDRLLS